MKKGSGSDPFADHEAETDDGADHEGDEGEPDNEDADVSSATTQESVESEQETTAGDAGTTTETVTETETQTELEAETDTTETTANSSTPHSHSATSTETTTFDEAAVTEGDSSAAGDEAAAAGATESADNDTAATSGTDAVVPEPPQAGAEDGGIPWVYVRDNVKQDRGMVQFYLRDYLVDAEDEFVAAVSDELGTEVSKTDVREAAYEAAMHNVDDVVERLEAWGFESAE